jgi:hypothetical protein
VGLALLDLQITDITCTRTGVYDTICTS